MTETASAVPAARVLIVDDHPEVRQGVRAILATEPTLSVVGEASSGDEALGVALVLRPDIIVLDHEMPGTRGLEVLPKLRVILPGVRVVMFTMSSGITNQARVLGADAVVAKDDLTGLVAALRRSAATRAEQRPSAETRRARAGAWRRALILAALVLLYVATFVPLSQVIGDGTLDLAILLVAAAGALFGLRGGLIAAAVAFAMNAVLVRIAGLSDSVTGSPARVFIALAIGAAVGRLRDVTVLADAQARSLAETSAALQASDRRLVGLVEQSPVLLVSVDPSGVIVDALGEGFKGHPKFSPELMRGQQAAVFYGDNPELLARLGRALSGEEISERVERYGFVYDVYLRPKRDVAGTITGTSVTLINVSARTAVERPNRIA